MGDRRPGSGMSRRDAVISTIYGLCMVGQLVLTIVSFEHLGLDWVVNLGFLLIMTFVILGALAPLEFRRRGGIPPGKSWMETTWVVDTGIYSVVRHPQWLAWTMFSVGMVLVSQNWSVLLLGAVAVPLIYLQTSDLDRDLLRKFGTPYREYIRRVPRMNLPLGMVWRVRRGRGWE